MEKCFREISPTKIKNKDNQGLGERSNEILYKCTGIGEFISR